MFSVFFLAAAVGVIAVALLFLFWRNVDRRVQLAFSDESVEDMTQQLEEALEEIKHLTSRVEHLEAIVASEPWDLSKTSSAPPLVLPEEEEEEEEDAPKERTDSRQRSR